MPHIGDTEVALNNLKYFVGFIKTSHIVGMYFTASLGTTLKMWAKMKAEHVCLLRCYPSPWQALYKWKTGL